MTVPGYRRVAGAFQPFEGSLRFRGEDWLDPQGGGSPWLGSLSGESPAVTSSLVAFSRPPHSLDTARTLQNCYLQERDRRYLLPPDGLHSLGNRVADDGKILLLKYSK